MNLWNLRAPFYRIFRKPWPLNAILKKESQLVHELLTTIEHGGGRALDIGCGIGHSMCFAPASFHIFGMDKSQRMVKTAAHSGISNILCADAEHLPLRNNSFDLILAIGLSEYLQALHRIFRQVKRTGKKESLLILTSSPPGFFSILRNLTGSKIIPRPASEIIRIAQSEGLSLISQKHFFSQDAFLFQISKKYRIR